MEYTEKGPKSTAMGGIGPDLQGRELAYQPSTANTTANNSDDETRRNSREGYDDEVAVGMGEDGQPEGVDVEKAKAEYEQLRRQLSRSSSLARQQSRMSSKHGALFDPEKGGDIGEEFDLK